MSKQAKRKKLTDKKLIKLLKSQVRFYTEENKNYMEKIYNLTNQINTYDEVVEKAKMMLSSDKEFIFSLQKELDFLRAENYNLKHRGVFKRILGVLWEIERKV